MFTKIAYTAGTQAALAQLGLAKFAGMLPPPSAMAKALSKPLGLPKPKPFLPGGTGLPEDLYQAVAGPGGGAGESATSQWFRQQLDRSTQGMKRDRGLAGTVRPGPRPVARAPSTL